HFIDIINGMISGASGRKRVQPGELENIEIPLPTIAIQKSIVDRWSKVQDEVKTANNRIAERTAAVGRQFSTDLGLRLPEQLSRSKVFAVQWKAFTRWGVGFNTFQKEADLTHGKYPVAELGDLLTLVQYGTSEKASRDSRGVAVIRMNNIVNGSLQLANIKYIDLKEPEKDRLLLRDGDILFNRTNSKEL